MTSGFNPNYQQFQDKIVRELAWVIASPPLLQASSFLPYSWFQKHYKTSLSWLRQLDKNPSSLHKFLHNKSPKRLGKYFESLLKFWFLESPDFDIILSNFQLLDKKQTIGEIDFLIKENTTNKLYHFEVAIKFYLQNDNGAEFMEWIGPNTSDRLAFKFDKLINKQLQLLDHPAAKDVLSGYSIEEFERKSILKGFFFYDLVDVCNVPKSFHQQHVRGKKIFFSQFLNLNWEVLFVFVEKSDWFSIQKRDDDLEFMKMDRAKEFVSQRMAVLPNPFMLIAFDVSFQELHRIMIIPDSWPEFVN